MPTLGETRVRTSFNPSATGSVDQIKQRSAELIDIASTLPKPDDAKQHGEFFRLTALAMTAYEEAAMWAVKAATFGK